MSLLGTSLPEKVTVNELTTVASTFTAAQFIRGSGISGLLARYPDRIQEHSEPSRPRNWRLGQSAARSDQAVDTTLVNLNTLGSLISAYATVANDDWRARFLKAATPAGGATPKSTLEAMVNIARASWVNTKDLYALFDEAYAQRKDGSRRAAAFAPYLAYAPSDFALMLRFTGGGACPGASSCSTPKAICGAARIGCPARSPAALSTSVADSSNSAPRQTALPADQRLSGHGRGWHRLGTAVTRENVWTTGLNGKLLVTNFNGKPVGNEGAFPLAGKVGGLQGVYVAHNGDVWIADATKNQMLHFPGGRLKDGSSSSQGPEVALRRRVDKQNRVGSATPSAILSCGSPPTILRKRNPLGAGIAVGEGP